MSITAKYLYDTYAQESFDNSRDHGFWDDKENRNKDEMVMLMINELSECQEALRSNNHMIAKPEYDEIKDYPFDQWYKNNIKGCTGEELADVCIRIFDFIIGWDTDFLGGDYYYTPSGNFSADLLKLVKLINSNDNYENGRWAFALSAIVQFANDWNIDLDYHIRNKQRYNRTRPYKHGKLF